ncbi:TPA: helix-turn-helix transcriptional regulator [Clostridioides difficile]|nr:helix-turn-helix transcriptional regulator [Clostridioides difficile]
MNRLKELRKEKNLSSKKLGEIFNVSSSTILRYEKNEEKVSLSTLKKLAEFYNVSLDYLLYATNERNFINTEDKNSTKLLIDNKIQLFDKIIDFKELKLIYLLINDLVINKADTIKINANQLKNDINYQNINKTILIDYLNSFMRISVRIIEENENSIYPIIMRVFERFNFNYNTDIFEIKFWKDFYSLLDTYNLNNMTFILDLDNVFDNEILTIFELIKKDTRYISSEEFKKLSYLEPNYFFKKLCKVLRININKDNVITIKPVLDNFIFNKDSNTFELENFNLNIKNIYFVKNINSTTNYYKE